MNNPQSPEGTPPGGPRPRPGDLVRVDDGADGRLSFLAFVVEPYDDLYLSIRVRHANKLGHITWVCPDRLELVQRGNQ